ncbi:sortase domain-bontaining protein [Patescibacteria group bacterium]
MKKRKVDRNRLANMTLSLAKILTLLGIVFLVIAYAPSVWYQIKPEKFDISQLLANTALNPNKSEFSKIAKEIEEKKAYQPRKNPNLTKENTLTIATVGIQTKIHESTMKTYEEALKRGVWRVPNFGTPTKREYPTIMAAHRFGYLKWSVPYRLKNSFYSLPKVKVGDNIEIIWDQRMYHFEVYKEGKGEEIEDYSADLILYTCEDLSSPVRIFKYAKLLEI